MLKTESEYRNPSYIKICNSTIMAENLILVLLKNLFILYLYIYYNFWKYFRCHVFYNSLFYTIQIN